MDFESQKKSSRHEFAKLQQTFCQLCKIPNDTKFKINCFICHRPFHLECLLFKEKSINFFKEKCNEGKFRCPKCITCEICKEMIVDPEFIECYNCSSPICGPCIENQGKKVEKLRCKICKNYFCKKDNPQKSSNDEEIEEENYLIKRKLRSSTNKSIDSKKISKDNKQSIMENEKIFKDEVNQYIQIKLDTKTIKNCSSKVMEKALKKIFDMEIENKSMDENDKIKIMKEISHESDFKLYINSKKKNTPNLHDNDGNPKVTSTLHYHNFVMKGLFPSKYPYDIKSQEHIYVCRFCLTPLPEKEAYIEHDKLCSWKHPPGNEIYRDEREMISIFEVDGKKKPDYARRLCWLASLFIPHKVSAYSVWFFQFYILTKITKVGFSLIGYFSKEMKPSGNNNLSCILTMPHCMGHGYGQLLIDLSYSLSKREKKIGSPEHPLSDQGLIAYRKYWKSILLCYIRQKYKEKASSISLKELSYQSAIFIDDLVSTALSLGIIGYNKFSESYLINMSQAIDQPLKELRRKVLKEKLLIWSPENIPTVDGWSRYDC
ncbi:Histone acetyltransferase KAT7 [Strongyloides ratti]|uniref:Histone acetyltransferase n=1 Tax=Strongyloides ratti TaxID=34506 RepID=A0A090L6U7_STRRB|nr:Histone acetyltransferase KAT7 [Strongyloides ratti]CEF65521.1 Histone acetyltransferase KAT7 [Strongyloides ratti]